MKNLDNRIESLLGEAGLNESERQVYLACLNVSHTSRELVQKTGMPRPTVMAALDSLQSFGLCKTQRRDGRSYLYTMQPVAALNAHLGKQIRELDGLMERLSSLKDSASDLNTSEAAGQQAVQELIEQALRCKSRQWCIIAPHDNALRFMPKTYIDYFKRVRNERQITSQTLWEAAKSKEDVPLHDVLMRKPRYVPKDISKGIPAMLLAFDDYLLAIEGTSNPSAVLIQNRTVSDTFKIVFELAWRGAR